MVAVSWLSPRRPDAAERLAREAAEAGRDVIAIGGDGTVAEIGNGILSFRAARGDGYRSLWQRQRLCL